jgi:hypothetical protein
MYYTVQGGDGVEFMDNPYIPFGMNCFIVFVSHYLERMLKASVY